MREGEEADKKWAPIFFNFLTVFFAPPPKIVCPFRLQRALNLRRPAQESLRSRPGIGPKSAQASADFGTFPTQETARICAAGRFQMDPNGEL